MSQSNVIAYTSTRRSVGRLSEHNAAVLVVGNTHSRMFPSELLPYTRRRHRFGRGSIKVNLLVNYSWQWDLSQALMSAARPLSVNDRHLSSLGSAAISRIDLVLRWGGRRRLSGFLPIQTVYSDFYIIDEMWPDYERSQLDEALAWYQLQDVTLGG